MSSVELYNWYEKKCPDDFKQLIKLKRYNFTDLSYLLNKFWDRLDNGEKLLMCSVYNEDINLAKQMLNLKQSPINPFNRINRKLENFSTKCLHHSSSFNSNMNRNNGSLPVNKPSDKMSCFKKRRFSHDLTLINKKMSSDNTGDKISLSRSQFESEKNNIMFKTKQKPMNSNDANFLLDQTCSDMICEMSAFYFAVKLNNFKFCQLFTTHLQADCMVNSNSNPKNKSIVESKNEYKPCFSRKQRRSSASSFGSKFSDEKKAYLNSVISSNELTKLICIALSNRNFDIARLILSNVNNPKEIFYFQKLSESFIYNEHFCFFLIKNQIIEASILLKEAISRHATETTYYIIDQLECVNSKEYSCNLYRTLLKTAMFIGDINIFKMFLNKMNKLDLLRTSKTLTDDFSVQKLIKNNYLYVLETFKMKSNNFKLDDIDYDEVRKAAAEKGIDLVSYFKTADIKRSLPESSSLSNFNRLKLLKYLFSTLHFNENEFQTPESIKNYLSTTWIELETQTKATLASYDRIFAATEYKENIEKCKFNEQDMSSSNRKRQKTNKRFYLGKYMVYAESEPFLINELLKKSYQIRNMDLIQAVKSEISELTIFYLINNIEVFNSELLEPVDEVSGNFLEIIFCRMVNCKDSDREQKLRRIFFEAVILKNAKMTCSFNLLDLFTTNNEYIKRNLFNVYFPCLYFLNKSFGLFQYRSHFSRFNQLTSWYVKKYLLSQEQVNRLESKSLGEQQIDSILVEFYIKNYLYIDKFDFSLKEMARSAFVKSSSKNFINQINDSTRQFIFYFYELKKLFS